MYTRLEDSCDRKENLSAVRSLAESVPNESDSLIDFTQGDAGECHFLAGDSVWTVVSSFSCF
jgi:hypothetical protein